MFPMNTINFTRLISDEPSNHLDVECIEALGDALSAWGKKDGAIIVVSHDRTFCDSVGFNTVGTVKDGSLVIEERPLNNSDWEQYDLASQGSEGSDDVIVAVDLTPEEKEELKQKRKKAYNAPKRIQKLEKMIEESEEDIAKLDDKMMSVGSDVGQLTDLSNEKVVIESKVADMMEEWEELELLLEELSSSNQSE